MCSCIISPLVLPTIVALIVPRYSHQRAEAQSNYAVLEMNLWISSFKNAKSKFSRIFVYRDMKGMKNVLRVSGYIYLIFDASEMSNYFKMGCIWPKMTLFQV